jgi:hypothetical protein
VTGVPEPASTPHASLKSHIPHSTDRNLRLQRLEHQVQVLAAAVRTLADDWERTTEEAAGAVRKLLEGNEL